MKKHIFFGLLCLLILWGLFLKPQGASDAFEKGDYETAYKILNDINDNNKTASDWMMLGMMYEKGIYVEQDFDFAIKYYANAIKIKPLEQAYFALARIYYQKEDAENTLRFVNKLIQMQSVYGYSFNANLYEKGIFVNKNQEKTEYFYTKAAETGDATSVFMLSVINLKKQEFFKAAVQNNIFKKSYERGLRRNFLDNIFAGSSLDLQIRETIKLSEKMDLVFQKKLSPQHFKYAKLLASKWRPGMSFERFFDQSLTKNHPR